MSIGAKTRHPEWDARTSGAIAYTQDIGIDDLLVGAILRAPHAHARIVSLDTSAAERLEGVAAVLTAADLPERNYIDYGSHDRLALAKDLVSHFGQEVAIVAAQTTEQAERALASIAVRYRPLPATTNAQAALASGARPVRPDQGPSNITAKLDRRFGDPQAAREASTHLSRAQYEYGIQAHACMEPQSVVASWDGASGTMHVWTPTQSARNLQFELAHMIGVDIERVRVHGVAVGGDFGARVRASEIEVLAAHLSKATGRPVSIALSRADEFAHTKHQHGSVVDLETGVDEAGSIIYRGAELTVENGDFTHGGSNMMSYCSILLASQYRLKGAELSGQSVYINRRAGGSFRGAGGPQAAFAMESQVDEIAERLALDPIDFRLANVNQPGETTITGWEIGSAHIAECIDTVRERLDWDAARPLKGSGRGVGMAIAMHPSGAIVTPATARAEAAVEIGHNGGITLSSGCSDPGTGETTVIVQIAAHALGVRPEDIGFQLMDTGLTPYDPGAGASRATYITGNAVRVTAEALADELRGAAAVNLGVTPDAVRLRDGFALAGGKKLPLGELAAAHPDAEGGVLRVEREHVAETPIVSMVATDPGHGNLSPCYGFAAQGVEVEVDRDTGLVRVLRVVAVHDAGTIINPIGARGQVVGGVAMGLGAALGEQLLFQGGRPNVTGYGDYFLPRAADTPPIEVVFVGDASPRGPYGAKALAELALMPTAAAVANAVAHATGVRVRSLPISPDKIMAKWPRAGASDRLPSVWRRPGRWWPAAARWAYPRGLHHLLHRWGTRFARPAKPPRDIRAIERPADSAEAVALLAGDRGAIPIGGATDLMVARDQGLVSPSVLVDLMDCTDIAGLGDIAGGDLRIGAAATLSGVAQELEASKLPGDRAIAATIETIASTQIREAATVAGNLSQANRCWFLRSGFDCYKRGGFTCPCYAVTGDHRYFHAVLGAHRCQSVTPSDLATTFTALDAVVTIKGAGGARTIPVASLFSGPGETVLGQGEIIEAVTIPAAARARSCRFEKLSLTEGGFAVASACVSLERDDGGVVTQASVILGGVANTPYRARRAERAMIGHRLTDAAIDRISGAWAAQAHPLPNNGWKVEAACGVLKRVLAVLANE